MSQSPRLSVELLRGLRMPERANVEFGLIYYSEMASNRYLKRRIETFDGTLAFDLLDPNFTQECRRFVDAYNARLDEIEQSATETGVKEAGRISQPTQQIVRQLRRRVKQLETEQVALLAQIEELQSTPRGSDSKHSKSHLV